MTARRDAVGLSCCVLWFCSSGAAWAQRLGQAPDDNISFVQVFAALVLCLGLAIAAAFVIRGRMNLGSFLPPALRSTAARLRLVESLRVGPQVHLCIVACDAEELLVEVSPQGSRILKELAKGTPESATHRDASP